jgi:purine-cytosine permease-like protein
MKRKLNQVVVFLVGLVFLTLVWSSFRQDQAAAQDSNTSYYDAADFEGAGSGPLDEDVINATP